MERKPFPSETQERFIVRLPDGMRDRIAEAAKTNSRSMNAEVVARLSASFEPPALGFGPGSTGDQFERARQEMLEKIESQIPEITDRLVKLINDRLLSGSK